MIWRTEESRNSWSEILMAISIAALAARSYRSVSYFLFLLLSLFLLLLSFSATRPACSALSRAERQILRILCAASISPIGHWTSSSQISLCLPLSNHHIARPEAICEPARQYRTPPGLYRLTEASAAARRAASAACG